MWSLVRFYPRYWVICLMLIHVEREMGSRATQIDMSPWTRRILVRDPMRPLSEPQPSSVVGEHDLRDLPTAGHGVIDGKR
jgi:hypothetical protein